MTAPTPRTPTTADEGPMSYAIFQLARAHRARAAAMLREMDLHLGQELLLMHLLDRDGQTQSELLESVGLDHSTVSKSLRRMQDSGLLVREPAEHDRRVMVVHLTDKGRAMREPLAAMWRALEETSALNLSAQQAESFVRTAYAIADAINGRALPQEESE
ncbi:MarR family winged helix-turn-helix transcriptional regulator [Streptomyces europaeiscabiei]|uniref:MarR family winged helix-turn-helix transcriptional regulator n=1 Tax=Streptomyces europaeiscabiei TaxID=146819 RepID=UPI0029B271DD|nr:MarR family winged helix-turn-helix transcriptional regulator [Streptomyces europaeiscabiei]MDX3614932.1 MarR family winged helix-turn-helix transcriptional regulator [Streptomyces europaeiscabiei]MDX3631393.1 MarR family winged helix-turn-helix transcriptional regulator [Streptomyces europaeiscabiei]MDX3647873.1 MarR family winged helix-turn-helix transcriptional regulator [Streptomyces europaeiscabiei]WUD32537.1 MarR family winged helix-turn-helix transcriptional regulator [Streptomyces eu